MNELSQNLFYTVLFTLTLPITCFLHYSIAALACFAIPMLIEESEYIFAIFVAIPLLSGIFMLPIWYKTFFNKNYIGLEVPHYIRWINESVYFKGSFFKIEVPVENISYKLSRLLWKKSYLLQLKVKKIDGSIENFNFSTRMPGKEIFLDFLKERLDCNQNIRKVS